MSSLSLSMLDAQSWAPWLWNLEVYSPSLHLLHESDTEIA